MSESVRWIFAGLFVALVLATTTAWWLGRRPGADLENVKRRIRAWWVMIAVGALALLLGHYALVGFFALLSWFALREFLGMDASSCRVMVPLQYLAVAMEWEWVALLALPLAGWIWGRERWLGLILCVYGLSFVPALGRADWMVFLVLVVQASDVLQYLWGRTMGRRAVAPVISPGKTVEGLVGGVGSAALLGGVVQSLIPLGFWSSAALALGISGLGFVSGLVLSAVKRRRGIKDWGTAIAGHGGVLDRVDSLCLPAPIFWIMAKLWFGESLRRVL